MAADCVPTPGGRRNDHTLMTQGGKAIANHPSKESCQEHLARRYGPQTPQTTSQPPSLPDAPTNTVP